MIGKRLTVVPALLFVLALSAAACGSSSKAAATNAGSSSTTASAPVTVHLGYFPNITHATALVGVGKVLERPWAVNGMVGVRPCVRLTLAADHRATDGFIGARFLDHVDRLLHSPQT